jgi:hypothetical protein
MKANPLLLQETFAVLLLAGVMLTVMPLLPLGTNQGNKVMENASLDFGPIISFYLDEINNPALQQDHLEKLVLIPTSYSTTKMILLFMSLQACLHNHSGWQFLLKELIPCGLLWFVAV